MHQSPSQTERSKRIHYAQKLYSLVSWTQINPSLGQKKDIFNGYSPLSMYSSPGLV